MNPFSFCGTSLLFLLSLDSRTGAFSPRKTRVRRFGGIGNNRFPVQIRESNGRQDPIPLERIFPVEEDPFEGMDQERRDNLFQHLLRDYQVEGVPLLGIDAEQSCVMQAAIWTTMAELSEQVLEQKVCLVFEALSINTLKSFVDYFEGIKGKPELVECIPEIERFSISMVGKGVGPAILLEVENKTDSIEISKECDVFRSAAVTKAFVSRMFEQASSLNEAVPSASPDNLLNDKGLFSSSTDYRVSDFSEICHIMTVFWNSVCELSLSRANPPLCSIVSVLPSLLSHARFMAVSAVISMGVELLQEEAAIEPVFFHPQYDRDAVIPSEDFALGHLPPKSWLNSIVLQSGNFFVPCDEDLDLNNYQRRSAEPLIITKLKDSNSPIIDLDLGTRQVQAKDIEIEASNLIKLVKIGKETLEKACENERNM